MMSGKAGSKQRLASMGTILERLEGEWKEVELGRGRAEVRAVPWARAAGEESGSAVMLDPNPNTLGHAPPIWAPAACPDLSLLF